MRQEFFRNDAPPWELEDRAELVFIIFALGVFAPSHARRMCGAIGARCKFERTDDLPYPFPEPKNKQTNPPTYLSVSICQHFTGKING